MGGRIIAGGKLAAFYAFTNGTSPTYGATTTYVCSDQISTDVAMDDSTGVVTVTLDNVQDDSTLNTFIEGFKDYTIASVETLNEEDSTVTLASSNKLLLGIFKGSTVSGGADAAKTKSFAAALILSLGSGAWKQEMGKYNRVKLSFKSVPILGTFTLLTTMMTSFMTTAGPQQLNTSTKYGRVFYG